jgi:hypothetical protein
VNFCLLLRLDGRVWRKEQSAKSQAKDFGFFTVAYCRQPILSKVEGSNAWLHRITLSALANTFGGIAFTILDFGFWILRQSSGQVLDCGLIG